MYPGREHSSPITDASRKAYDFLSQVDLENLPIAAVATGAPHRVRLPRMQQHQQLLLEKWQH